MDGIVVRNKVFIENVADDPRIVLFYLPDDWEWELGYPAAAAASASAFAVLKEQFPENHFQLLPFQFAENSSRASSYLAVDLNEASGDKSDRFPDEAIVQKVSDSPLAVSIALPDHWESGTPLAAAAFANGFAALKKMFPDGHFQLIPSEIIGRLSGVKSYLAIDLG